MASKKRYRKRGLYGPKIYNGENIINNSQSIQYSKDITIRLVKSFNKQYKAFTTTLLPKPLISSTSYIDQKNYTIDSNQEQLELEKMEVK